MGIRDDEPQDWRTSKEIAADIKRCPLCGGEMNQDRNDCEPDCPLTNWWICSVCGHEEKVR